jgi:GntR family transcriptional regulator/MocR family aminotransferase
MAEVAVHPLWGSLALDRAGRLSLQDQIVNYFRDAILSGRMPAGRRVPSSRQLASEHGISRMTAIEAYERLTAEGYLFSRDRAGLFVCNALPDDFFLPAAPATPPASGNGTVATSPPFDPHWHRLPLTPWMPAVDHFPWKDWARMTAQVLRERPIEALHYGDPRGELSLREAIAEYLGMARGITCTPDQIVVVSSSKHGVDMAARQFGRRGDEVWFEEPGHTVCRNLLAAAGLVPVPIPVDHKGLDVAEAQRRAPHARLALISPSHQLPMGVTMSLDRRLEMLKWAETTNAWILEDDHDGEYCYSGRPVAPFYTLDRTRTGRVIYIGSFSNLFAPGLRMGYMVVPPGLVGGLLEMHASLVPTLTQLVVARFIGSGRLSSHLRRMRKLHGLRRNLLVEAIERHAADVLHVGTAPEAGIRLLARLVPDCDDETIARRAIEARVHVHPLSRCYAGNERERGFILGFASTAESEIEPAVRRLAEIVRQVA